MNLNLNFGNQNDYNINESLIDELINMYGVSIKLLVTEKINQDDAVFGDFTHMKTDEDAIYSMFALPEESEDFSTDGYSFSPFGMESFDNVILFISKASLSIDDFLTDGIVEFKKLQSQLIIFPNNKIMEITDVDPCVPGVNNLFTHGNEKSVYKVTCKPYAPKIINEIDPTHITAPEVEDYDFTTEFGDPEILYSNGGVQLGDLIIHSENVWCNENGEPVFGLIETGVEFSKDDYPELAKIYPSLITEYVPNATGSTVSYKIAADYTGDLGNE